MKLQLDYSQIQVKLFTFEGVEKASADCAPNNGYYLLPFYVKGDHILKVVPPQGWSFGNFRFGLIIEKKKNWKLNKKIKRTC